MDFWRFTVSAAAILAAAFSVENPGGGATVDFSAFAFDFRTPARPLRSPGTLDLPSAR